MAEKQLKPGWKVWRFDQIATNVNERVDNPSESGMEHYVGLEHLDSDSLKIRRWGSPDDVEATKLVFRKGDIIFGRRRAYQRKLGIAEFDGICSAHAMVLRAKPDVVVPEFLPFFMQSDVFMNRAVEISVGSLSPTINWRTLAVQDFALPPLDAQGAIVELLNACAESTRRSEDALNAARHVLQAYKDTLVGRAGPGKSESCLLSGLLLQSPESGCSAPPRDAVTGHFVLGLASLSRTGYVSGDFKSVEPTSRMLAARLAVGDLLISRSNTADRVGYVGIFTDERNDVSFPDTMMRLKPNPFLIDPRYLEALMQATPAREYLMRIAAGTSASMKKINRANLLNMPLRVPPLEDQRVFLATLGTLRKAMNAQLERLETARSFARKAAATALDGG